MPNLAQGYNNGNLRVNDHFTTPPFTTFKIQANMDKNLSSPYKLTLDTRPPLWPSHPIFMTSCPPCRNIDGITNNFNGAIIMDPNEN